MNKYENSLEQLKIASKKIIDSESETDTLFREFMEFWDLIDEKEFRQADLKKQKIFKFIHKMHNDLYAIEQMIEEIK